MLGGEHASHAHQNFLVRCAQSCAAGAAYMLRLSVQHTRFCIICAEDCERMGDSDATMANCAKFCRQCGDVCLKMDDASA